MAKVKQVTMMFVILAKQGAKCPNPSTGRPLPFGEVVSVPDAPYWHRRMKEAVVRRPTDAEMDFYHAFASAVSEGASSEDLEMAKKDRDGFVKSWKLAKAAKALEAKRNEEAKKATPKAEDVKTEPDGPKKTETEEVKTEEGEGESKPKKPATDVKTSKTTK
jgi:hypothetical protein